MYSVNRELGSVGDLQKRFKAAKAKKEPWNELLRECYEYALPQRETFYQHFQGEDKQREVYDSTAILAVKRFVSFLQSSVVPAWREWTRFSPGPDLLDPDLDDAQKLEIERLLDVETEKFFHYINHSNFITEVAESFGDLAIGTGALYLGEPIPGRVLNFQSVPLSELILEDGPFGTVENVWREHEVSVRNIPRMYPKADIDDKTQKLIDSKPETKVKIIEGTLYIPKLQTYQTVVMRHNSDQLLWAADHEVSPWIVFRWSVTAGETYGRGPVMDVLPDIKTVNVVKEFILRNAALNVGGIYTAVDDGVINPYSIEIAPNTIIPVSSNETSNPSIRPLDRAGDPQLAQLVLNDLQENIKKALFNSMLQAEGPVKSATEISIAAKELAEQSSAAYGRMQTELIYKVVTRAVHVLTKAGKMEPISVDGRMITLKHTSPLAQMQDQADLANIIQYFEVLGMASPEAMMMGVKIEDAPEIIGRKLGVEPELIRGKAEREEMQQNVAQIIGQQGQAQIDEQSQQ